MLIDLFSNNAFGVVTMGEAIQRIPYVPQGLAAANIFTPQSLRTTFIAIEDREDTLGLIQTSARGAPLEQRTNSKARIRNYETTRIAKMDTVLASELSFTRQFGTEDQIKTVQSEVARRWGGNGSNIGLIDDVDLTLEHMRLGAIQGKVLDADGSVITDWTTEFDGDGTVNSTAFNLASTNGAFREQCVKLVRSTMQKAKGAWRQNTMLKALCGNNFWDTLVKCPEVREQYRNAQQRAYYVGEGAEFSSFEYGGILWENYRGTDDNSEVAIHLDECVIFPINAPGMFVEAFAPGEKFADVGALGQRLYADALPDRRDTMVELTVYSYPIHICTRPKMLNNGTIA